ncbi:MAG: hypothetical protein K2O40_04865 [Lachnospiraceae bacterium]|nr:hypothetical protein [Lachnospiraceae bacterium]
MIWITEAHRQEAAELMKKWEEQGCTYEEVETKIAALNSCFSKCKEAIDKQPFKMFS